MKTLQITRSLVSGAVSLHLRGLQMGLKVKEAMVARSMQNTDLSNLALQDALALAAEARATKAAARNAERQAKAERDLYRTAAQAEADLMRRGVTL